MRRARLSGLCVALWLLLWLGCAVAGASGPRFVTGPPFFPGTQSLPIGWKQANLLYSTDPGNLSATVPHAAADALVAAAAGVWNLPVASITVGQGGPLAEHVSGANVYLDASGMVYPADVMSSNAAAVPIAVIYDTDGSVTDTLLGAGASGPASCNSNAVTSTVDSFDPAGYILHAIIILNGRCTGPAAAQQLQMQYKLERTFGRVLGLAWSQNNDNVFTGSPTPTYNQALHWPILHPIDILCGLYSYQCLPDPFTLRPDDVASMVEVYPIGPNVTPAAGKQTSLAAANGAFGTVTFPDGQGMAGVNVLAKRQELNLPLDAWDEVSGVTGTQFRRAAVSPFVTAGADAVSSMGTVAQQFAGTYNLAYIPFDAGKDFDNLTVFTEPVNPLYTGAYSLGPYGLNAVAPSGSTPAPLTFQLVSATYEIPLNFPIADAASLCGTGLDGVAADPAQIAASGWWNATICGYGHASYLGVDVKPGRTFTVEATALDANGLATTTKAMPVIGLFAPTDQIGQPGSLPSLGVAASAFQGLAYGTTVLEGATGQWSRVSIGIADERGDGRPDFPYQGRMFYADSVEPTQVPDTGGTITITGMGFRAGNAVLVNGVAATATRWSANSIVATVPTLSAAEAANGTALDVEVLDRGTGATSTIKGALTYSAAASLPNAMILLSAPAGTLPVGMATAVPLAVRVVAHDGVTPVAGDKVIFSVPAGSASFGACGANTCSVPTDATGTATTTVTPLAAGAITLQAADGTLLQTAGFTAQSQPGSMTLQLAPQGSFPVGVAITTPFVIRVFEADGVTWAVNEPVTFTVPTGSAVYNQCNAPVCTCISSSVGACVLFVTPTGPGPVTLQASAGSVSRQASFTATQDVDTMVLTSAPNPTSYVGASAGSFIIQLLHGDGVTGDYGELVNFTISPGASLAGCSNGLCQLYTDAGGRVGGNVSASQNGTFTITARYGALSQTATFSATTRSYGFKVLSVPSGQVLVGTASALPFTVQLIAADGVTPMAGYPVVVGSPWGQASLSLCGVSVCTVATDANGIVSTRVTPLMAGSIPINVVYSPAVASTTVTAVAATDTLVVVSQPGGTTLYPGDTAGFRVQLIKPDGATPDAGENVTYTVTSGSFSFSGCGLATCSIVTDAQGMASIAGIAGSPGAVVITASYGSLSQAMKFSVSARADVLQVISAPASGASVGVAAPLPFAVRVLKPDGVTPAAGELVTLSVTNGAAGLAACNGASACALAVDAAGLVTTLVTPLAAGGITLQASDGSASQSVTFTAVNLPDTLRLVSAPASGAYVGVAAAAPLAVRVILGNGNAAAGKSVTVKVTNGMASFGACAGASSCTLTADANGNVSTAVTPLGAGAITLSAADGAVSVTASFNAVNRADVLQLVSAPANGSLVGDVAAVSFAVRAFAGDGTTPLAGHALALSVTGGSANFTACGAAVCTLSTDATGLVSTGVVPLAAGVITLQAADGSVLATASFTAAARPDLLTIVAVPTDGAWVGAAAPVAFAVRLTKADGVTPSVGNAVVLSAGNGRLGACGASSCTLATDVNGFVSTTVTPVAAGTVTLLATTGALTQAAAFTAVSRPDTISVLSIPANGSVAGSVAAVPFSVQVLAGDGSIAVGRSVTMTVTNAILTACGAATCLLTSDAKGDVTSGVAPLQAGTVNLTASEGAVSVSASFVANAPPDVLQIVSVPANGSLAGKAAAVPFAVQVLAGDGSIAVGRSVTMTVTNAILTTCGAATCLLTSDTKGDVTSGVIPLQAGTVNLTASEGAVSASASFIANAPPDVLQVVSVPANGSIAGKAAAVPFTVQVVAWDGSPAVGRSVMVAVTNGTLIACGAETCVLSSDAKGDVTSGVIPLQAGTVSLTASEGAVLAAASFVAGASPDNLSVASVPANGSLAGSAAAIPFSVHDADTGGSPVSGRSVTMVVTNAILGACGASTCLLTTDSNGNVSTAVTPSSAGVVNLQASEGAASVTASFMADARPDLLQVISTPGVSVHAGATAASPFAVKVLLGDGSTPAVGIAVTFSALGGGTGAVRFGACGGSSCVVATDASGTASTPVEGVTAGALNLLATADPASGAGSTSWAFQVVANDNSLNALEGTTYVAEGAVFHTELDVSALSNGVAAASLPIVWTSGAGLALGQAQSSTNANGTASAEAAIGPLAGGARATATACAWNSMCASFAAIGVGQVQLQIAVVQGGQQAATGGAALAPVVTMVSDRAGHPVAGAAVTIYQTATALTLDCPAQGRCPAQPVLASKVTVATSAGDGTVSVQPLVVGGTATQTNLSFAVGAAGFCTASVTSRP